jgi:excisionase family DNA binding protein
LFSVQDPAAGANLAHMSIEAVAILISRKQSAALLGVSVSMVDKLIRKGELEAVYLGDRVLLRRADVESLTLTPSRRRAMERPCSGSVQ